MFTSIAYAQSAPAKQPSMFETIGLPMIFLFLLMYIFILRPQGKKMSKHQEFLNQLKKGDEVLTSSGIYGTIEGITEKFVTLEVSDGVRLRIAKNFLLGKANEEVKT